MIRHRFELSVGEQSEQDDGVGRRRNAAFMLCRRALLQGKVGSYAEQFEGLYTLMRGWTAVAWISVTYLAGWIIGYSISTPILPGTLLALSIGAVVLIAIHDYRRERNVRRGQRPPQYDPWPFRAVAISMLPLGALLLLELAPYARPTWQTISVLSGALAISLLLALRFHSAYHYFAGHFAETVYRDFYVLERYRESKDEGLNSTC
jgi:hypothetical protein